MNNAREFLQYIADNERRLKHNLKKNITYDDALFDDVFQTTIIKVYDSIVKNDKMVDDFERYFFISSKFEYILKDNRKKKANAITDDVDAAKFICDSTVDEEYDSELCELLTTLKQYLFNAYGEFESNVFLDYYTMKADKKCSYKMIADEYGISIKDTCRIIKKIKSDEYITATL